ncbi:hypothetical protein ABT340_25505 [Streptosporangium sp. NPDC000239]|uniref:hypothetical protein n=1 Tax=Streptosporangium sp. NPDC000239 TaxID=3154248 RepID=UPI00332FED1E
MDDRPAEVRERWPAGVDRLIAHHGFGPDNGIREAAVESGYREACPGADRNYLGTPAGIRNHRRKARHQDRLAVETAGRASAHPAVP